MAPTPTATVPVPATSPVTQVLWTSPRFNPSSVPALEAVLSDYGNATHRSVEVQVKAEDGPAGMAAFLDSTAAVVPEELPDVALVALEDVPDLIDAGALVPLGDDVAGALDDMTPFAKELVASAGAVYAVPVAVDVAHAIGRGPVPATWSDSAGSFVVPLGTAFPDTAALVAMLSAAGAEVGLEARAATPGAGAAPDPSLETAAITTSDFLKAALRTGQLLVNPAATSPRGAWSSFLQRDASWAAVSGATFLEQQSAFPALEWGPIPGLEGPAPAVAWGWGLAAANASPGRVAGAEELIDYLTQPERAGWADAGGLPPRASELGVTGSEPASDAYVSFLSGELARARAIPSAPWMGDLASRLTGVAPVPAGTP